jgi:hypothetical protein
MIMTDFKDINVGDKIELVFNNNDRISGEVTTRAISNTLRLQTVFGGDTFISLHEVKEAKVLTPRISQEPFEPEGEGYIWGYVDLGNIRHAVFRSPEGQWNYKGKTGPWERLYDRVADDNHDKPFTFVRLVEAEPDVD